MWLVFVYMGSNTVLNLLNVYWFGKMFLALGKRFEKRNPVLTTENLGLNMWWAKIKESENYACAWLVGFADLQYKWDCLG